MLATIICSYFTARIQNGTGLNAYGLFNLRQYKRNLIIGLSIGFALSALANFLSVWLKWNALSKEMPFIRVVVKTIIFGAGTFAPSLAEDILTRGYLFAHWDSKWGRTSFVFVSAILFTTNHFFRISHTDVMLYLFILGLLLAGCLMYTGSLWLTSGIHWGTNIAYQFFANIVPLRTVKETGMDNYLLAACYFVGLLLVTILYRFGVFRVTDSRQLFIAR